MTSPDRIRVRVDRDGVRTIYDARAKWVLGFGALASCIVAAAAIFMVITSARPRAIDMPAPQDLAARAPAAAADDPATAPVAQPQRRRMRAVHVARAGAPEVQAAAPGTEPANKEPELLARDVIPALVAAGEKEGIAAFPPPGTDPIKRGIVVPDDFELPEGYARHYQTTDDGEQLAPILTFAPNYDFIDDDGRPVPLPEDGIVTPEMAPAGLPIRMLRIPRHKRPDRAP